MNKESNKYIFLYSIGLVVVVAVVLSIAATLLKPFQEKNKEVEKKQNILLSVQKGLDVKKASNKTQYVEREYAKYITNSFIVNNLGQKMDGDAFEVDLTEEMAKPEADRKLPVFVCSENDGTKKYILPVRGAGLWGAIWGYIALMDDFNTISGAVFDHKGETPGLGAEIAGEKFQRQFSGKEIFDGDVFTSIKVVKNADTKNNPHEVDAISGGTITSNGVQDMLQDVLSTYANFFKEQKKEVERVEREKLQKEEDERLAQEEAEKAAAARRFAARKRAEAARLEAEAAVNDESQN